MMHPKTTPGVNIFVSIAVIIQFQCVCKAKARDQISQIHYRTDGGGWREVERGQLTFVGYENSSIRMTAAMWKTNQIQMN